MVLKEWLFGKKEPVGGPDGKKKIEKIVSVEEFVLHESGMRAMQEFEIALEDGQATVSLYGFRFGEGKRTRELERRATCGAEEALNVLNRCGVSSWDGFDGPHPKGVLDGTQFSLRARFNGGLSVSASGSENFPPHYRELMDWIYDLIRNAKTEEAGSEG